MIEHLKKLGFLLPLIIFILLSLYLWRGLSLNPRELPSTLINKSAPVFSGSSIIHPHRLITEKVFTGKLTLFHVWATWCNVCQAEHPYLVELARDYKVNFIGLNYKDDTKAAFNWLKQKGNPYKELIEDTTGKIAMDWGVYGTPETFIVDQKGIIRYKYTGMLTPQVWQEKFLPILQTLEKAS